MKKRTGLMSVAAVALVGWAATAPVFARPPTVGVNPGYDRRLIESRKELGSDVATAPAAARPVRHRKHIRHRY
jgi:hypothetical protein